MSDDQPLDHGVDWDDESTSTYEKLQQCEPLMPGGHRLLGLPQYKALYRYFDSTEELLDFIEDGGDLTDVPNIGEATAPTVRRWFDDNYPERAKRLREKEDEERDRRAAEPDSVATIQQKIGVLQEREEWPSDRVRIALAGLLHDMLAEGAEKPRRR